MHDEIGEVKDWKINKIKAAATTGPFAECAEMIAVKGALAALLYATGHPPGHDCTLCLDLHRVMVRMWCHRPPAPLCAHMWDS